MKSSCKKIPCSLCRRVIFLLKFYFPVFEFKFLSFPENEGTKQNVLSLISNFFELILGLYQKKKRKDRELIEVNKVSDKLKKTNRLKDE